MKPPKHEVSKIDATSSPKSDHHVLKATEIHPLISQDPSTIIVAPGSDLELELRIQQLKDDLAPEGANELVLFDRIVVQLRRLHRAQKNEPDEPNALWMRYETMADRGFWKAHAEFHKLRAQHRQEAAERAAQEPEEPMQDVRDWRERIEMVPEIDPDYPVVKGTDLTVEYVCSMLADRWSFRDILDRFPKLHAADLLACRLCEIEGKCCKWPDGKEPHDPQWPWALPPDAEDEPPRVPQIPPWPIFDDDDDNDKNKKTKKPKPKRRRGLR